MVRKAAKKLRESFTPDELEEVPANSNNANVGIIGVISNDTHWDVIDVLDGRKGAYAKRMRDLKPHQVVRALRKCGAKHIRSGSHAIFEKNGIRSAVPLGHKTVNSNTLKGSLRSLGISVKDFCETL